MRFAVFHNQPSGGARRALAGFCRHLRQGHDVDVYALTTADDDWVPDRDLGRPMSRVEHRPRTPVRLALWLNDVRRGWDLDDLHTANQRAAAAIDAGGYDAVLVDVCRFSLVPPVLAHLRTPAAYYAHNGPARLEGHLWAPSHSAYERMRDWWHGPVARRLERRVADDQRRAVWAADVVLANSAHTATRVATAWGRTAMVCPPGVDLPAAVSAACGADLLSVGELEPRKGFDFLVQALGYLPPGVRPRLRVCAHRANQLTRRRLERQAEALAVRLRIDVDPSPAELEQAFAEAAVFVYGAHQEALGLAPLEAMARGCPVVAVAEGGVTETVLHGRTGLLTRRRPLEFAQAVRPLLDDPDSRGRLAVEARRHVEREWSWAVRGPALEEALVTLARTNRSLVR